MHVTVKTPEEQEKMRVAGRLAADVLDMIGQHVVPGVTTDELDKLCHDYIVDVQRSIPANLNYRGFPKTICTSVNHVVCHGIPNDKRLKAGDIVNIDVTVIREGFHGDTSRMYFVGKPPVHAQRLAETCFEAMWRGIETVKPGTRLGDIGHAIQAFVEERNYSVVREYCGHGIGRVYHEDPQILHYGEAGTGMELKKGMTFTVEPMVNAGKRHVRLLPDGWTVITKDHSLSAQWEHTVLVTDTGVEVLTLGADSRPLGALRRGEALQARPLHNGIMPAGDIDILEEPLPLQTRSAPWLLLGRLPALLAEANGSQTTYREYLRQAHEELKARFLAEDPIEDLVHARAALIDVVLREAWRSQQLTTIESWSLVAVGGYGRGELHPCSDIDILLLVPAVSDEDQARASRFVTFLWDIGLEVGHSVRTVDECVRQSTADVSVMTTLIEARHLAGNAALVPQMRAALSPEHIWPVREFFDAKVREQAERHAKANDTAYNLEPNVKTSPGGLRDIQTIAWVAKRHFSSDTLDGLATRGFLSVAELRRLKQAQAFLWKVRFALHIVTGRREDRLLFDHQIRLAQLFGYEDASYTLAVEQFMQRYYRTVMDVSLLNELLLQLFREAILSENEPPRPLNARFQVRSNSLEAVNSDVFARTPSAILELFVLLQQNPEITGVRASTMRAVARNLWLIDEEFRQNPRNHRLFLEIVRSPVGVTHELRRMNTYGVLGRYIPAFGRVVGRMQYDLFHAYTVDAHTLFVVSNLRRFAIPRYDHELPAASRIMQSLPRQEIAYLAALFHDIAKGRGGDHSELGGVDAEAFCLEQGLSRYDARLVAWLVRNHLELSITAQKQDISDPEVISAFARKVGDETHLDYLYVLTCADVRGTNPKLWNSWKASLFHDFYDRVKRALRRGLESPIDQEQLVRETQEAARRLLVDHGISDVEIEKTWERFAAPYFLRHTPDEVAWHTRLLAERDAASDEPLVALDPQGVRGTTSVMIFARPSRNGFARTTAVLDQLGLNIVDARITPTGDGFSLDLYHVLEDTGAHTIDEDRKAEIEHAIWRSIQRSEDSPFAVSRRAPRQARMFNTPTQIQLSVDDRNRRSVLELTASDRPGLLSDIGKVLMQQHLQLQDAKIMTVGERAEDVFYITDFEQRPLSPEAAQVLRDTLMQALDRRRAA